MSSVYVVQRQQRWDPQAQKLVDKFDLSPAEEHGDLRFLLSPSASPFKAEGIVRELQQQLQDFDCNSDCLLLIGNPVLIGLAVAVAAERSSERLGLLQWHGREGRYLRVSVPNPLKPL